MRREMGKLLALAGAVVLAAGRLGGCAELSEGGGSSGGAGFSGSIRISGSSSMEDFTLALAEGFMEKYPDVEVDAEFVGSGAGIEAVAAGSADIGSSSRYLKDGERARGVVENVVAADGIAVCVDKNNGVEGLTLQQLRDIYIGVVRNWKDVGGADAPIVVVGREAGSGTREAFEKLLKAEDRCAYSNELDTTGAVAAKVGRTPGAIGYVSLDAVDDSVRAITIEGAEPTVENIRAGRYSLSRPFIMATRGEISAQSELVQAWFGYVYGEEGQETAVRVGLVNVR